MKHVAVRYANIVAKSTGAQTCCTFPSLGFLKSTISIPIKIVATTTANFPRKRTKSPTVLIAVTRRILFPKTLKALKQPTQKLQPCIET